MATANEYVARFEDLPRGSVEAITNNETLLILAPNPGDESQSCGGLIARSCKRGRPPFVMVLGDGGVSHSRGTAFSPERLAILREQETRTAARRLGLPEDRLLMVGLFEGAIPEEGPIHQAIVRAVTLVMWARDCNVICTPWRHGAAADDRATYAIAAQVAAGSGVGLLAYAAQGWPPSAEIAQPNEAMEGWRLDIASEIPAKRAAIAAHASLPVNTISAGPREQEVFLRPAMKG